MSDEGPHAQLPCRRCCGTGRVLVPDETESEFPSPPVTCPLCAGAGKEDPEGLLNDLKAVLRETL